MNCTNQDYIQPLEISTFNKLSISQKNTAVVLKYETSI